MQLADWEGLLEWLESQEDCTSARAAVQRMERRRQLDVALPRPMLPASDAVNLLSIHRSTGLEWPVVFLVDQERRRGGAPDSVVWHSEEGVAFDVRHDDREDKPSRLVWLRAQARHRQQGEERRLRYVALTRAREVLFGELEAVGQEEPSPF